MRDHGYWAHRLADALDTFEIDTLTTDEIAALTVLLESITRQQETPAPVLELVTGGEAG